MKNQDEKRRKMRRWLNRYRFICKEIAAREKHLLEFERDIYNPLQAVQSDGMPKGNGTVSDQTYRTVMSIERTYGDLMADMKKRIAELKVSRDEIEKALTLLDEYESSVLYHRFILGIYWADLPAYIGYERTQCQVIETRALDRLIKSAVTSGN